MTVLKQPLAHWPIDLSLCLSPLHEWVLGTSWCHCFQLLPWISVVVVLKTRQWMFYFHKVLGWSIPNSQPIQNVVEVFIGRSKVFQWSLMDLQVKVLDQIPLWTRNGFLIGFLISSSPTFVLVLVHSLWQFRGKGWEALETRMACGFEVENSKLHYQKNFVYYSCSPAAHILKELSTCTPESCSIDSSSSVQCPSSSNCLWPEDVARRGRLGWKLKREKKTFWVKVQWVNITGEWEGTERQGKADKIRLKWNLWGKLHLAPFTKSPWAINFMTGCKVASAVVSSEVGGNVESHTATVPSAFPEIMYWPDLQEWHQFCC